MCTDFMCHMIGFNVVVLTSSSRYWASLMCTDLMCHIIGLIVVVLTYNSRNLVSVMCADLIVTDTGPQASSTDL